MSDATFTNDKRCAAFLFSVFVPGLTSVLQHVIEAILCAYLAAYNVILIRITAAVTESRVNTKQHQLHAV